MHNVTYIHTEITMNKMAKHVAVLPEWEFHVIQAARGEEACNAVGEEIIERPELPDPRDEFERLAQKYGPKDEADTPYVAQVYGTFGPGVKKLRDAIASACEHEAEMPTETETEAPTPEPLPVNADAELGEADGLL